MVQLGEVGGGLGKPLGMRPIGAHEDVVDAQQVGDDPLVLLEMR